MHLESNSKLKKTSLVFLIQYKRSIVCVQTVITVLIFSLTSSQLYSQQKSSPGPLLCTYTRCGFVCCDCSVLSQIKKYVSVVTRTHAKSRAHGHTHTNVCMFHLELHYRVLCPGDIFIFITSYIMNES